MTAEEELIQIREENSLLREQVGLQKKLSNSPGAIAISALLASDGSGVREGLDGSFGDALS